MGCLFIDGGSPEQNSRGDKGENGWRHAAGKSKSKILCVVAECSMRAVGFYATLRCTYPNLSGGYDDVYW